MKKSVWAILAVLFFSTKFYVQAAQAGTKFTSDNRAVEYVPGEVIVKFKPNKMPNFLQNKSNGIEVKQVLDLNAGEFAVISSSNKLSTNSLINNLNNNDNIEYAEPNFIYHAINNNSDFDYLQANDPKFGDLWGLLNTGSNEPIGSRGNSSPNGKAGADINALAAWTLSKGSSDIKIAVIDTGVDYNHEDLKNNIWTNMAELNGTKGVDDDGNGYVDDIHGYDFANKDGDPMDGNGHGTHCSGTIAGEHDNGVGVAGVMAHAQIVGVKFLSDQGSGTSADALAAIDYATKIGVDIMSNSWGGGGFSQALYDVIKAAHKKGIIFTAAAGNSATDNNTTPHYPSNYDLENVISVAAHNYNDTLASFSCYGSTTVHVSAPGRNILSTVPNNAYDVFSGTSMATPHVTGVVGLYLAYNGKTDPKTLRTNRMNSSVYANAYGRKTISGGRVDAYNFLTGIVADRPAKPSEDDWMTLQTDLFESIHPYPNKVVLKKTYSVPGAKFLRMVIAKHELENNYDVIIIKNGAGDELQRIDGIGHNVRSEYVEGDTLTVEFHSDESVNKWGFEMSELEYIQ